MLISSLTVVVHRVSLPHPVWSRRASPQEREIPTIFNTLEKLKWPGSLPKQSSAQLSLLPLVLEIVMIGIYQRLQHTQQVRGKAEGKKLSILRISLVFMLPLLRQTGTVHSTYRRMMLPLEDQILLNPLLPLANDTHVVIKIMPVSSSPWCCPVLQSQPVSRGTILKPGDGSSSLTLSRRQILQRWLQPEGLAQFFLSVVGDWAAKDSPLRFTPPAFLVSALVWTTEKGAATLATSSHPPSLPPSFTPAGRGDKRCLLNLSNLARVTPGTRNSPL